MMGEYLIDIFILFFCIYFMCRLIFRWDSKKSIIAATAFIVIVVITKVFIEDVLKAPSADMSAVPGEIAQCCEA